MIITNDTIEKVYSMVLMVLLSVKTIYFLNELFKGALAYVIGSVGLIF